MNRVPLVRIQEFQSNTRMVEFNAKTVEKQVQVRTCCQERARGGGHIRLFGNATDQNAPPSSAERTMRSMVKSTWGNGGHRTLSLPLTPFPDPEHDWTGSHPARALSADGDQAQSRPNRDHSSNCLSGL